LAFLFENAEARGRSKAPIATSRNNASNGPAPGGAARMPLALRINRINCDWNAYGKALARPSCAANDNTRPKSPRRAAWLHHFGSHPAGLSRVASKTARGY